MNLDSDLRPRLGLGTVLHYAACALGMTIGFAGFGFSALVVLFGVAPESSLAPVIGWLIFGAVLAWELVYRPATSLTAGIGTCALLLLVVWLAGNILVA